MDDWRAILYYPLGILPALFFGLRILFQWVQSERVGQSVVFPLFWRLSLAGNLLAFVHYFIQLQFPFALIQAINAVISWRNLDLMRQPRSLLTTKGALMLLGVTLTALTTGFALQGLLWGGDVEWTRVPVKMWGSAAQLSHPFIWHIVGSIGGCLFASRFWVQWWLAEMEQQSSLSSAFWWLTIWGNVLSLIYFARIGDTVSLINNGFSAIPALRNLMLLARRNP